MIFLEEYPAERFDEGSLRLFAPTNEPLGTFLGWNSKLVNWTSQSVWVFWVQIMPSLPSWRIALGYELIQKEYSYL